MKNFNRIPRVLCGTMATAAIFLSAAGAAQAQHANHLTLPAWNLIYDGNGNIDQSQLDGARALFIEDVISNGVAVDMSRLVRSVRVDSKGRRVVSTNRKLVGNGKVATAHDVGNSYVVLDGQGDSEGKIYAATERLNRGVKVRTFVEFEFTSRPNRVKQGSPWPVNGITTVNDLRARVLFVKGAAKWLQVRRAARTKNGKTVWRLVLRARFDGSGCAQDMKGRALACVTDIQGGGPIKTERRRSDGKGKNILVPRPNSMVELALDSDALTSGQLKAASMIVRTPSDIALLGLNTNGGE